MQMADIVEAAVEGLPLPVQLGVIGSLLMAIVVILRWQSHQVQSGKLVPKATYDDMVKEKDLKYTDMLEIKNGQIADLTVVKNEWHEAHTTSEAGRAEERETTREAVKATRAIEPILAKIAEVGDNGRREGQPL